MLDVRADAREVVGCPGQNDDAIAVGQRAVSLPDESRPQCLPHLFPRSPLAPLELRFGFFNRRPRLRVKVFVILALRGVEALKGQANHLVRRSQAGLLHPLFDKALGVSRFTALNLDVGHYYGVNGKSPVPVIEKYHDRIASLHLKDRKGPGTGEGGGPNMPWGQGETPLKEVLQLMKKNRYKFPGSIEYEYNTPEGSDVLSEVKKCVEFCKAALA